MARFTFGATLADWFADRYSLGSRDVYAVPDRRAPIVLTVWPSAEADTEITDLLVDGHPATEIRCTPDGRVPQFQGPDEVRELWLSADGSATRWRVVTPQGTEGPKGDPGSGAEDPDVAALITAGGDTEAAIDAKSATTLQAANTYADERDAATLQTANAHTDVVDADLQTVKTVVPTNEDLFWTWNLHTETTTAQQTWLLGITPFDVTILSLNLVFIPGIAASNTNYWTFNLDRYIGGTVTPIASRTTQTSGTTAGGEIAGQTDWNFDGAIWATRQLPAGALLRITPVRTGTPADMPTRINATIRYQRQVVI